MRPQSPRTQTAALSFLSMGLALLASGAARADANIIVDGNPADWAQVTTCFDEREGDARNGIDLVRLCVTDNNSSGNSGSLFTLYEADSNYPSSGAYVGFVLDRNRDERLTSSDEVFAVFFSGTSSTPTELVVYNYDQYTGNPKRRYTPSQGCGGPSGSNSWSARRSGRFVEFAVSYGCLGLSYNNDSRLMQTGAYPNFDLSPIEYYEGSIGALAPLGPPPPVSALTAVSRAGGTRLNWTNPRNHQGVLIVRRGGTFGNFSPTQGRRYNVGESLGGGTVVYTDTNSSVSSWTDTNAPTGTSYYLVFNHHQNYRYSTLKVPNSQGLKTTRLTSAASDPKWCYSTGFPAVMQPVTELGVGIFHAGNNSVVSANRTTPSNPATDGDERWRPLPVNAPIQSRFPIAQLADGRRLLFTGDQSGYTFAFDPQSGTQVWAGRRVGTNIQAQPAVQLAAYSNDAFKQAYGSRDIVFFVARDSNATPRVVALYADDGSLARNMPVQGMGNVSGGMLVDYANNRLWIPAESGNTLTVISTLDGTRLRTFALGASIHGVNLDFKSNQVYFTTSGSGGNARVYGIDLNDYSEKFRYSPHNGNRVFTNWVFPTGSGFIATSSDGTVRRIAVDGSRTTQLWSAMVQQPSGVTIDYATQKIYAGSSNGRVYELDAATGAVGPSVLIPGISGAVGQPTIDSTAKRLHVGTMDGRVCAYDVPF